MLPIVLDVGALHVVLIGEGEAALKRLELLDAAGASSVAVYSAAPGADLRARAGDRLMGARPSAEALGAAGLVFIAGLADEEAAGFAATARRLGRFVNTEDRKALCDFHVPSVVRRGDLLLTVSTGGRSPGLARRLRRHLEGLFGPEWSGRIEKLAERREGWRAEGLGLAEIGQRTEAYIREEGWLP